MVQSYNRYRAVTPSDSADIGELTKAVWVGGAGNLVAVAQDGTTCTFTGVPAGSWLPLTVKRINSTNTTATSIVALFQQ
jgi:hypothetical protein